MGSLSGALRQLDSRQAEAPASSVLDYELPVVDEAAAEMPLAEPLPMDYAEPVDPADAMAEPFVELGPIERIDDGLEVADETPVETATFESLFTDSSFNQVLHFADAAIEAAESVDDVDVWPTVEISTDSEVVVVPAIEPLREPTSGDFLSAISLDRSYGQLWDRLTAAMHESPPWAICVAGTGSRRDASWLLPMAAAFAQRHAGEVLVVDATANQRDSQRSDSEAIGIRGGLNKLFGLASHFGLAEVLQAAADWRAAIAPTTVPRVNLLASGDISLFTGSEMKTIAANLIADLKSSYQLVLIQADDASEPLVAPLAAASDGALLMVELGRTSRAAAEKASSSLYLAGARLLGCVTRG